MTQPSVLLLHGNGGITLGIRLETARDAGLGTAVKKTVVHSKKECRNPLHQICTLKSVGKNL